MVKQKRFLIPLLLFFLPLGLLAEVSEQYLTEALELIQSTNATNRTLGWSALVSQIATIPVAVHDQIETAAIKENSPHSLKALTALYKSQPALRLSRLLFKETPDERINGTSRDKLFYLALLSEFTVLHSEGIHLGRSVEQERPHLPRNDPKRFLPALLYDGEAKNFDVELKQNWTALIDLKARQLSLDEKSILNYLLAIELFTHPQVASEVLSKYGKASLRVLDDFIYECMGKSSEDALLQFIPKACQLIVSKIKKPKWEKLSVQAVLDDLEVEKFDGKNQIPETLNSFYPPRYRPGSDTHWVAVRLREYPERYSRLVGADGIVEGLRGAPGRQYGVPLPQKAIRLEGNDTRCLVGCVTQTPVASEPTTGWQLFTVIPKYQGALALAFFQSGKIVLELSPAVEKRPDIGYRSIDRSLMDFVIRGPAAFLFELEPSRFRQHELDELPLIDLASPVKEKQYSGTKLSKQWMENLPPMPADLNLDPTLRLARMPDGWHAAREAWKKALNEHAAKAAQQVSYTVANGLLTYVSSFHRALLEGGWLVEREPRMEIEKASMQSFARFLQMGELAKLSLDSTELATAPWKERQKFLRQALPIAALQLSQKWLPELQRRVVFLGNLLSPLKKARQMVVHGLKAYDRLSQDEAFALLEYSNDALELKKPELKRTKEQLATALLGAEEELRAQLGQLAEKLAVSCEMLGKFQYSGSPLFPKIQVEEPFARLCQEVK